MNEQDEVRRRIDNLLAEVDDEIEMIRVNSIEPPAHAIPTTVTQDQLFGEMLIFVTLLPSDALCA